MAAYRVFPHNGRWVVLRARAKKSSGIYRLRRDAIACAKNLARGGVVTVHDSAGGVVIRIPGVKKVAASVHIARAADMTPAGRRAVAAWLVERAEDLVAHGRQFASRFRARYIVPG